MFKIKRYSRYFAFWGIDYIKGGRFKKHLHELNDFYFKPEKNKKYFNLKVNNLLEHATQTTVFYKDFSDFKTIQDFPIVNKKLIKERYSDFLSDKYVNHELQMAYTSGTTGTPFEYPLTDYKYKRRLAEVLFFNQMAGYKLGVPFAQVRSDELDKFYLWKSNSIIINPRIMDKEWFEKQRNLIKNRGIEFLISWPSVLINIINYCISKGDTYTGCNMRGIVTTAEPVSAKMLKSFEDFFRVPVYNRYATEELGIVAHECKSCHYFHVNTASHCVEILKLDSDTPAEPGETGRVVVTDLHSHALPLIRYDIGDIAIQDDEYFSYPCVCKIKDISGRMNDLIYKPTGEIISWATIQDIVEESFNSLDKIVQYQFVQQTENQYILYIVNNPGFDQENNIYNSLSELLGNKASFEIKFVKELEELASGKCPTILNKMKAQM